MNQITNWYLDCIREIYQYFYEVEYDDIAFKWILIPKYVLPKVFRQKSSALLMQTPGMNIENHDGYSFFMDLNLSRSDGSQGKHFIEMEGYNPYRKLGYCALSYHLQLFNPKNPASEGDTLFTILQSLYGFLGQRW